MMLLSEAKVARRWASCGDAASRKSGGAGLEAEADVLVGDEEFVGEEAGQMLVKLMLIMRLRTHIYRSSPRARI